MNEQDVDKTGNACIDPLDDIFVDKNISADKKILAEILRPFVTIDSDGAIDFSENYDKLTDGKKVLVYLCCRKAMVLREVLDVIEECCPKEISDRALVSVGGAKVALYTTYKKLLKKGAVGTFIPNYNLKKVMGTILENG